MTLNLVPFVSVDAMMRLVHRIGIETVLRDLAAEIEAGFRRWPEFDKTPRIAAHSEVGAIPGAQIITTCTADKTHATILNDDMVGSGVHIDGVGGACPGKTGLAPAILHRAGVFTEDTPQTRIEGELQQLSPDHPVTELREVAAGRAPGRTHAAQVTLFDSPGFAIEDFAALRYVHARLPDTGLGRMLDMIADPDAPREFYMLMRAAS